MDTRSLHPFRTRFMLTAALAAFLSLQVGIATAQTISKGTLSGTILSGVASAPAGGTVTLLTAPATGHTILIQVCFTDPGNNLCPAGRVSGSTLGQIKGNSCSSTLVAGSDCTRFDPGIILPPGEVLSCIGDGGFSAVNRCTASAIVSSK